MVFRSYLLLVIWMCAVFGSASDLQAQKLPKVCAELKNACENAGFVAGKPGNPGREMMLDCINPLVGGRASAKSDGLTLPTVSAGALKACGSALDAKGRTNPAMTAEAATPPQQPIPVAADGAPRPNFVLVLVDDLSMDLVSAETGVLAASMPNLAKMQSEGATFDRFFVTDSLCCPSRTSLFTGLLPHNSGVYTNAPPTGGYKVFVSNGNDDKTIAVALHDRSYLTSLNGKYLNGYDWRSDPLPPGWSDWGVASNGYPAFDVEVNENGKMVRHPEHLTDWLSVKGQAFIANTNGQPFFIELAPFSPHAPFLPPARYADSFNGLIYPRTPAFGARPNATAPAWLQSIPALESDDIKRIDAVFRARMRADKAIDDMIGDLRAALDQQGLAQNTYVIFTSDNGFHLGDYSLRAGKLTPFDTDIHVPLIVVGPGIAAGRHIPEIAMNVDLYPTIAELAGIPDAASVDGRSLVALLNGQPAGSWRTMAVIEHKQAGPDSDDPDAPPPRAGDPPDYVALRFLDAMYVEYGGPAPEISYYDLATDPYELNNIAAKLTAAELAFLHQAAAANHTCAGADCLLAQSLRP